MYLIKYTSLRCFAIKFRRWVISKGAPLSCNLNACTLVLIPLDFSFVCLSSLLQRTDSLVSTGNATALSRIHISYISTVMIFFLSFCMSLCTFQKQSLTRKILPKNSLESFQSESIRCLCMCIQSQGGLARAQETSCQITVSIITVRCTFGQDSMWYTFDSRVSDPVTEACLCYLFYTKNHLAEAKREEKSEVTCEYCQRGSSESGQTQRQCYFKHYSIFSIILWQRNTDACLVFAHTLALTNWIIGISAYMFD